MKYSIPKQIDTGYEPDGAVFFAQRMEEMLANNSIDLYKMPLLNTHSLAAEYCMVAAKVNEGLIKEHQKTEVFNEFLSSFSNDIVLKENWGINNIERVKKSIGSSSEKNKTNIIAYIDATLGNGKYFNWAKETILKYTEKPREKKKIEEALRCFLPELIMWGYEPEYISSMLQNHFFKGKVISKDSVKEFLEIFDLERHSYKVYFAVSSIAQHFRQILEERLGIKFEDDGNYHLFKSDRNKDIIHFNDIWARCPNAAAKIAYNRLDMFFSFYKYVGNKRSLSLQNKAMVIEGENKPFYVSSKRQTFTVIEAVDYVELGQQSESLITGLLINAKDEYFMLSKAIELHNTAISITDLKSGFLNLWSSLEVLSQGKDSDNKFGPVLYLVSSILKKDYISTQIRELNKSLIENLAEEDYKCIIDKIDTKGCNTKKIFHLVYLEKYSELRNELYEKLADIPVLRSRISLMSSMNTTKKLNIILNSYVRRISWHLYRMYRTRNAIVHSGEDPNNLKFLGEHLHSYLDSTANEFIVKLSGDIPFRTREDILTDLKFAIDRIDGYLVEDIPINESIINAFMHPEIGYVMRCDTHGEKESNE